MEYRTVCGISWRIDGDYDNVVGGFNLGHQLYHELKEFVEDDTREDD